MLSLRMDAIALQGVLPDDLAGTCGVDLASARRIISIVHRTGALPARAPATVRRAALERVRARSFVPTLQPIERHASGLDPFVKFAFLLPDGAVVESVRIPLERPGRFSVCVSSQVGCALACAFCATGRMGLSRNLEAWEIVEQVRLVRATLSELAGPARVHSVLFQGMGEPIANAERVIRAIRVLADPSAQAIDMRNITVCTAGIPSGIRRLTRDVPAVRLGISIGSAIPGRRAPLIPIDAVHPLEETLEAAGEHARISGHAPMWAYALLADKNDGDEDAAALADLARRFSERYAIRPRISLIPFNGYRDAPFRRTSDARLARFRAALLAAGSGSIVRYSGGSDIGAACGQLARFESRARVDPGVCSR